MTQEELEVIASRYSHRIIDRTNTNLEGTTISYEHCFRLVRQAFLDGAHTTGEGHQGADPAVSKTAGEEGTPCSI